MEPEVGIKISCLGKKRRLQISNLEVTICVAKWNE